MLSTERTTPAPVACRTTRAPAATIGMLALAIACALASAASATAGQFHVYSCRTPSGAVAPTVGWSSSTTGVSDYVENGCSEGKALVAALGDGSAHAANTDTAMWQFSTSPEESLAGATLWRAGDADGGMATNATYEFWLAGPSDTEVFDECVYEFGCQLGSGDPTEPLSSSNLVAVPAKNLGEHLYVNASCGGISTYKCPSGKGDPNGYAAVVYLYAADLLLEQTSQPVVSDVEGELATASTLSGTADLSLHAEDGGSGVYEAVFTVDGAEDGSVLLDENGGHCRNVGPAGDGLPAFLYPQPCPAALSADIPFDTTALADGTHHLVVTVTNAAGNSTVALDRKIDVDNDPVAPPEKESPSSGGSSSSGSQSGGSSSGGSSSGSSSSDGSSSDGSSSDGSSNGSPPASSQSGSADGAQPTDVAQNDPQSQTSPPQGQSGDNGSGASAGAALHVRWSTTASTALRDAGSRASTALGQLLGPGGAPIAGALLSVRFTPSYGGARTVALASARTSASGTFRVRVPAGTSSGRVTFAYSATLGAAVPSVTAALSLSVPARLTLRVTPRVAPALGTIAFAGTLSGRPLPPGGKTLVLEARVPGESWRQFQVLSTGPGGRYRASYRFRLPGPIAYEFRAVSPAEADFPYAAGSSNVVDVREL